ncbi:MAG TPA: chromosomal replication initiator protein DnaA [Candidatus Eisenbacteria bacterium]|jgi:chromosomal replication initiator protein
MASHSTQTEETTRLWEQVLGAVKGRLDSEQAFETWFRPIQPLHLSPQLVDLQVPNSFFVDWIHEHYLTTLQLSLSEILGTAPELRFTAREALPPRPSIPSIDASLAEPRTTNGEEAASIQPNSRDRAWFESQLNPRHTFASFVVGSSNQFTHAACRAVAERPGKAYNPLFIFAGSGLGKTHLLHAVGHALKHARPDARVSYVPAERFTNEMIYAIQHAQTLAFRNKYRNVDLLLIDDIQFLAGKESTQEEFFYTFNALRDAHKQVVVTADKPPKDIPMLEERLTSRFNQGLVTDIKQPDLETRLAILRNRCEEDGGGTKLADDVLLLIADRIRNNVRDLEGCLVRVLALASLLHQEVTVEVAEEVLQHYVHPEPEQTTPERITSAVADGFGVKLESLFGRRRTQSVVLPRQVAMYLMRQLTELSLVEIGRMFGGRDHTTVIYACEKVAGRIAEDSVFADKINGLISTLASG